MSISDCLICKRILYNLLCLIFIIICKAGISSYILKTKQTLDRKGVWGRGATCICLAGSLCCSPETITTLLTAYQFSSVAQSCPTLCDPMNCSTPGLPVHHWLNSNTK